jgi:predicted ABC-class ATPase
LDEALARLEEKEQRRPKKWAARIDQMIEDIQELNERLTDLGLRAEIVDTEPLRPIPFFRAPEPDGYDYD